jgi:hypothetical protein
VQGGDLYAMGNLTHVNGRSRLPVYHLREVHNASSVRAMTSGKFALLAPY